MIYTALDGQIFSCLTEECIIEPLAESRNNNVRLKRLSFAFNRDRAPPSRPVDIAQRHLLAD